MTPWRTLGRAAGAAMGTAALVTATLGAGGCAARAGSGDGAVGERRAALARLVVENRSGVTLAIAFVYAAEPAGRGGEVGIGSVPPGGRSELAPVPAEEPILLIARGDGIERRLEPRTLAIDQLWTWVIDP